MTTKNIKYWLEEKIKDDDIKKQKEVENGR